MNRPRHHRHHQCRADQRQRYGIVASSLQGGTINIKTDATSVIRAALGDGINASNTSGAITIVSAGLIGAPGAAGVVVPVGRDGIYATNVDAKIDITNTATINARRYGIHTINVSGATYISNSVQISAGVDGINASSTQGTIDITTEATSVIEAARHGIHATTVGAADNAAAGAITIANAGQITAGSSGIYAQTDHATIDITADATSVIRAVNNDGIYTRNFSANTAAATTIVNAGGSRAPATPGSGCWPAATASMPPAGKARSASRPPGRAPSTPATTASGPVTEGAAGNADAGAITIANAGTINALSNGIVADTDQPARSTSRPMRRA